MIDRAELRKIARERLKDAEALLKAGRYDGAVYLGGYVVELALKSQLREPSNCRSKQRQVQSHWLQRW